MPIDVLKFNDEHTGNVYFEKTGMIIHLKNIDSVYINSTEETEEAEETEVEVEGRDECIDLVELNLISNHEDIIVDVEKKAEAVLHGNDSANVTVWNLVLITKEAKNVARAVGNRRENGAGDGESGAGDGERGVFQSLHNENK